MFHLQALAARNKLLRSLPPGDLRLLATVLKQVSLNSGDVLVRPDTPIKQVFFLEEGTASVVVTTADDQRLEVCQIGSEGMTCVSVALEMEETPLLTLMQSPGLAFCMRTDDLHDAMQDLPELRRVLLRYAHVVLVQTAEAAIAAGRFTVNQRLARWILMGHDRVAGDRLTMTHDHLALMLGVRRSGVTDAIHVLEGQGMIQSSRAQILITDRSKLIGMAGASYGSAEKEYGRALGFDSADAPLSREPSFSLG